MLNSLEQRVLLLTGGQDLLVPSAEEGKRLKRVLPRCRLKVSSLSRDALAQCNCHCLVCLALRRGEAAVLLLTRCG